jgi:hypothetical protein
MVKLRVNLTFLRRVVGQMEIFTEFSSAGGFELL